MLFHLSPAVFLACATLITLSNASGLWRKHAQVAKIDISLDYTPELRLYPREEPQPSDDEDPTKGPRASEFNLEKSQPPDIEDLKNGPRGSEFNIISEKGDLHIEFGQHRRKLMECAGNTILYRVFHVILENGDKNFKDFQHAIFITKGLGALPGIGALYHPAHNGGDLLFRQVKLRERPKVRLEPLRDGDSVPSRPGVEIVSPQDAILKAVIGSEGEYQAFVDMIRKEPQPPVRRVPRLSWAQELIQKGIDRDLLLAVISRD